MHEHIGFGPATVGHDSAVTNRDDARIASRGSSWRRAAMSRIFWATAERPRAARSLSYDKHRVDRLLDADLDLRMLGPTLRGSARSSVSLPSQFRTISGKESVVWPHVLSQLAVFDTVVDAAVDMALADAGCPTRLKEAQSRATTTPVGEAWSRSE